MSLHTWGDGDYADSDDMDSVLQYSRQFHESSRSTGERSSDDKSRKDERQISQASSSYQSHSFHPVEQTPTELRVRIQSLEDEIRGCFADVESIQQRIQECLVEKEKLGKVLEKQSMNLKYDRAMPPNLTNNLISKERNATAGNVNFLSQSFDWTDGLRAKMRSVFGIQEFRLCQEGVCNANMDGRDIVCIMPTGGGKSLTYQLPALLMTGCTLVISPLIALMTDQILHLREAGVPAAMITSMTSEVEKKQALHRLQTLAEQSISRSEQEIKLVYVSPEKMSKDKSFRYLLQKIDNVGKLARIVIDEAHCVSQLGHDFRKDYKELHILRKIFPRVPIMALSATCGPQVLEDLILILDLKGVVPGESAPSVGTVLFSSPLYRKNLHYRVLPKPDSTKDQFVVMARYILDNHPNETGIIYCLSKKDTETLAGQLKDLSSGHIKTGVYHADIAPKAKAALHESWRQGKIKVVCATIAFGMGIDKSDVRFVLHHSISKSLEGYYQESGRAGRDGKDSYCILFYRPQDAASLAATVAGDKHGEEKLHAMLSYVEELRRCRKAQFAEYFSHSELSVSAWTTSEPGASDLCGHCDNCLRDVDATERRDVTLPAWQLLKILQAVRTEGGKLTLSKLATLARGGAKGIYEVSSAGNKKRDPETYKIDLDVIAGGPVKMTKTDIEHLIVKLLVINLFQEEYQQTSYTINAYIAPGPMAARLNFLQYGAVVAGKANVKFEFDFEIPASKSKGQKDKKRRTVSSDNEGTSKSHGKKRKVAAKQFTRDDDSDDNGGISKTPGHKLKQYVRDIDVAGSSSGAESFDWSFSMKEDPPTQRRSDKPKSDIIILSSESD